MTMSVGDRMKQYESEFTSLKIDNTKPFVIRLDGHGFSKFTRGLNKPYDYNLHQAMVDCAKEMCKKYRPSVTYTFSDEISLIYYPEKTKDGSSWVEPDFGGRIQKIVSITAAYCTMIFNKYLKRIFDAKIDEYGESQQKVYSRMINCEAYFDSRIFQLPDEPEVFSYLYWRSKVDCCRNHVFGLACQYYSKTELHKTNTTQRIEMLKGKGVDWNKEPACFKRGTFFKRVKRTVESKDQNEETVQVIRSHVEELDIDLVKFDEDVNNLLKSKYLIN